MKTSTTIKNAKHACFKAGIILNLLLLNALGSFSQCTLSVSPSVTICSGVLTEISVSGGSNYTWYPSASLNTNTGFTVIAGPTVNTTYTVTSTCGGSATVIVTVNNLPTVIASNVAVCWGGSTTLTATGAVGYVWSPSVYLSSTTGSQVSVEYDSSFGMLFTYTVTGTGLNGCSNIAAASFNELYTPYPDINNLFPGNGIKSINVCTGSCIKLIAGGFTFLNNYVWSGTGLTNPYSDSVVVCPGFPEMYYVTVTSNNFDGCVGKDSVMVFVSDICALVDAGADTAKCLIGDSVTIGGNPSASGGTPPYTYSWTPAASLSSGTVANPQASPTITTTYYLNVIDAIGNRSTDSVSVSVYPCTDVWPGDANSDLIANNFDLLAIGSAYGATGPVRSGASNTWVGQPAGDWSGTLSNGVNYKHADCNGDGTINANDTVAILLNYGSVHNKTNGIQQTNSAYPTLYVQFLNDTIQAGTAFTVPVYLGTSSVPANNVYGVAFSVNYDPEIIVAGTAKINFTPSWMGTIGTNMIAIQENFPMDGRLEVGATRIDHQNLSGSGQVGTLNFTMKDDISGKTLLNKKLVLSLSNVKLVSDNGTVLPVNLLSDSTIASMNVTGIKMLEMISATIKTYPNPANDHLIVDLGDAAASELKLMNTIGQVVYTLASQQLNRSVTINTAYFPNGIYYLSIQTKEGRVTKKISIVN